MNFETSRAFAILKLENFIDQNLLKYSKLRNFDFGPKERSNISCLSPYITHGTICESEIIKKVLSKHQFSKSEKFIQEILWRIYWKGWLELRPNVWNDYLTEIKDLSIKHKNNIDYKNAINGNTKIECFNEWVNELKEHNYLHNHVRMWFASIWIFTLNLPWQLGADFFLKNLFDGDAASNTLGWRWVAGIQTQGKNYLASEWNIKKFTNNRFKSIKLNENAPPKINTKNYSALKLQIENPLEIQNKNLFIFDNNLSFEFSDFNNQKFKNIYLISNKNENRNIKLSEKVLKFKYLLIQDQKKRLEEKSIHCEIVDLSEIKDIEENSYGLYPNIGEALDYINLNKYKINFLYRKIDLYCWQYCNKGFFNFKNYIPNIINSL